MVARRGPREYRSRARAPSIPAASEIVQRHILGRDRRVVVRALVDEIIPTDGEEQVQGFAIARGGFACPRPARPYRVRVRIRARRERDAVRMRRIPRDEVARAREPHSVAKARRVGRLALVLGRAFKIQSTTNRRRGSDCAGAGEPPSHALALSALSSTGFAGWRTHARRSALVARPPRSPACRRPGTCRGSRRLNKKSRARAVRGARAPRVEQQVRSIVEARQQVLVDGPVVPRARIAERQYRLGLLRERPQRMRARREADPAPPDLRRRARAVSCCPRTRARRGRRP